MFLIFKLFGQIKINKTNLGTKYHTKKLKVGKMLSATRISSQVSRKKPRMLFRRTPKLKMTPQANIPVCVRYLGVDISVKYTKQMTL